MRDKCRFSLNTDAVLAALETFCRSFSTKQTRRILATLSVLGSWACQPTLDLGERTCAKDGSPTVIEGREAPVAVPWSTGFENGFCDYTALSGYCYPGPGASRASWELVTDPVWEGKYAAAFTIDTDDRADYQARCVRQGVLPTEAYYGARYYLPFAPTNIDNWNLFHFDGGTDLDALAGRLDVSLIETNSGIQVAVFGPNHSRIGGNTRTAVIQPQRWFRIQLYLKRSRNAGEIRLYLDGQQIFDASNVSTDDSPLGRWYVGNLAYALTPSDFTVYVDDITLRDDPS